MLCDALALGAKGAVAQRQAVLVAKQHHPPRLCELDCRLLRVFGVHDRAKPLQEIGRRAALDSAEPVWDQSPLFQASESLGVDLLKIQNVGWWHS